MKLQILAATDFSDISERAVAGAARLAAAAAARLDIVHVARPSLRSLLASLRGDASPADAVRRQLLDDAVADARESGVDARGHLVTGTPVATLDATCRRLEAELLVLGTRGPRGLRDHLLGTTAERLIERLPCAVLVVRRRARTAYRRLLACVDTSPAAVQALRRAMELCPDARVHVLHAAEAPLSAVLDRFRLHAQAAEHLATARARAGEAVEAALHDAGVDMDRVTISLKTGYPTRVIERAVARVSPDLITVGHCTSPLLQPFLGSVARHVLRIGACDVLVTR